MGKRRRSLSPVEMLVGNLAAVDMLPAFAAYPLNAASLLSHKGLGGIIGKLDVNRVCQPGGHQWDYSAVPL